MQDAALERLRCPACLGELRLESFAAAGDGEGTETGALLCERCRTIYLSLARPSPPGLNTHGLSM